MQQPKPTDATSIETRKCTVCSFRKPLSDYEIRGYREYVYSCKSCRRREYPNPPPKLTSIEKWERDRELKEEVAELIVQLREAGERALESEAWRDYLPPGGGQSEAERPDT